MNREQGPREAGMRPAAIAAWRRLFAVVISQYGSEAPA